MLLRFTILACILTLTVATAQGDEGAVRDWKAKLGTPARAAAVDEALEAAGLGESNAIDLARGLAACRGVEAARGLGALLKNRNSAVRIEALLGLARVGLRSDSLAKAVHERLASSFAPARERWAAVVALGAVGDGRDVAKLLEITGDDTHDRNTHTAAYRALRAITGARLPPLRARWTYWWKKQEKRAEERVTRALDGLSENPGSSEAISLEAVIAAHGWAMPSETTAALRRWLAGQPRGLVIVACRLTAYLRLADLAPDVARAGRGTLVDPAVEKAANKAATRLGVAAENPAR